jgi:hypothetical protein
MESSPAIRRRRFRFGLRTLLAVVTLTAVASWSYWFGWPWWVNWREQVAFENSVRQIKAGMTRNQWTDLIQWNNSNRPASHDYDPQHVRVGLTWLVWPNAVYCIFYRVPGGIGLNGDNNIPCSSIEVFRLPQIPRGYKARTESGKEYESPEFKDFPDIQTLTYVSDFFGFISGDRKNNPGFQYELIYSDPPETPAAK